MVYAKGLNNLGKGTNVLRELEEAADNLGNAGTLDGYQLNAKGMEIDQIFAKSLIGALCYDNIANWYTSDVSLDFQDNLTLRSDGSTAREHYWDEAVGYLYGLEEDLAAPDLNDNDQFLNKYLGKSDFVVQADRVYTQFIIGRTAIAEDCKPARQAAALLIKADLANVIKQKAIDYFTTCAIDNSDDINFKPLYGGSYMHYLAEGYGFLYALQFTDYMSRAEVMTHLDACLLYTSDAADE